MYWRCYERCGSDGDIHAFITATVTPINTTLCQHKRERRREIVFFLYKLSNCFYRFFISIFFTLVNHSIRWQNAEPHSNIDAKITDASMQKNMTTIILS
jgi:hypothetical protein